MTDYLDPEQVKKARANIFAEWPHTPRTARGVAPPERVRELREMSYAIVRAIAALPEPVSTDLNHYCEGTESYQFVRIWRACKAALGEETT